MICLPWKLKPSVILPTVLAAFLAYDHVVYGQLRQPESALRKSAPTRTTVSPGPRTRADGGRIQLAARSSARLTPSDDAAREAAYQQLSKEAETLQQFTRVMRRVVELSTPTVVHIESQHVEKGDFGGSRKVEEAGSGIIVRMSGQFHVVTNRHVVKGAQLTDIRLQLSDGRTLTPERVTEDPGTDIAVVTVAESNLIAARLGNSNDVGIGDIVLAMGSPFGLSHSVTFGIVSAKGRRDLELGREVDYQDFLQTDAAINPGNSGGPLLDLRGEVIGLNTAIASNSGGNEGIGFAIPINIVTLIVEQLIRDGHVAHAYLGVTLDNSFDADAAAQLGVAGQHGALVKSVTPGSPAELARLRTRDLILSFNGTPIESDVHLVNLVGLTAPDHPVTLEILRGVEKLNISITLQDRREFEQE
ncbi:MAG: trypsin-like peptidase domain-containing protein [Planctomycetota bacterium]|nr:trypsin-like peptidase domain-containing protein [Planctomycetota bacterium]MDA1179494.1 trypsin-like peptidase domain-containing protein [Planctomycetota bacterium]